MYSHSVMNAYETKEIRRELNGSHQCKFCGSHLQNIQGVILQEMGKECIDYHWCQNVSCYPIVSKIWKAKRNNMIRRK